MNLLIELLVNNSVHFIRKTKHTVQAHASLNTKYKTGQELNLLSPHKYRRSEEWNVMCTELHFTDPHCKQFFSLLS